MAYTYNREERTYGYDRDTDYSRKMSDAAAAGDYAAAARYEQQRNEKIRGENMTQYQPTSQYAQYLPKSNGQLMDETLDKILNRGPFSYDLNGDALYQQYKDQYTRQGKLAMQDTMGQAASLTGGYGNSYAQTVGQQTYDQYLGRMNDVIPELYSLARSRYEQEGNDLWNLYGAYADRENQDYSRYLDERNFDYQQAWDEKNFDYQQQQSAQDTAFSLAMSMLQSGIMPSDAVLTSAGLSAQDAQAIYDKAATPVYTGGSGRSTGSTGSEMKIVPLKEREELAKLYEEGGDDAIASKVAYYKKEGYDYNELWNWIHDYYTYAAPEKNRPWWQNGVDFGRQQELL